MPSLINLEIAAVSMQVKCSTSNLLLDEDPAYQEFVNKGAPSVIDIAVDLELKDIPDTSGMTKTFESGESWSMFREGNDYFMTLDSQIPEKPYWSAKMNRNFTKVTVYCSSHLVHEREGTVAVSNPVRYPLDQILLMYHLAQREGVLLHAAGIEINNKGYLFAGKSGAGKTTISKQFIAKDYQGLLSDDRIVIRKVGNAFKIFGTPWPGEGGIAINKNIPLAGIFFLRHAGANKIEEIKPASALESLLPVISIPWYDRETLTLILSFCEDLVSGMPAYILSFKPDTGVIDVIEKFISG